MAGRGSETGSIPWKRGLHSLGVQTTNHDVGPPAASYKRTLLPIIPLAGRETESHRSIKPQPVSSLQARVQEFISNGEKRAEHSTETLCLPDLKRQSVNSISTTTTKREESKEKEMDGEHEMQKDTEKEGLMEVGEVLRNREKDIEMEWMLLKKRDIAIGVEINGNTGPSSYVSFPSEMLAPDGHLRAIHTLPNFAQALSEARKARYIRHRGQPLCERELTIHHYYKTFRMNVLQRVVTGTARCVVKPGVDFMGTRCLFTGQIKRLLTRMSFNLNRSWSSVGPADDRPEISLNRLEGEDNGIVEVLMCREKARNSLGCVFVGQMRELVSSLHHDTAVRVVLFRSLVPGVFCAGADLKERAQMSNSEAEHFVQSLRSLMNDIAALPMPAIAAVDGFALGGGLELALACDIRTAAHSAQMGLIETTRGLLPGAGEKKQKISTAICEVIRQINRQITRMMGRLRLVK
ncbi:Enoyl-CoA hydratase domain-containing protein 2, mitochondrial [Triplophysa tibetana]|uniref:Enoyl-CoA hydratase domain-containing protein 2, mitochondrial n=1 Tax=Triplophysa tibetana TaxID=1572043 RepID=A0A5A9NIZ1_9TELE|nr:Enoyl-CoA hydratase domain-containing protein 2, mitochondrial [Triplophysa tibetana]